MSARSKHRELLTRLGLRLPAEMLKRLHSAGIFCQPAVSIKYLHHANGYVLRAVESGGAIAELGAYCGFVDADGNARIWYERINNLAVNGLHAIVMAPSLVRLEMVRNRLTYELLITRHSFSSVPHNQRPKLESSILFHGRASGVIVSSDTESPGEVCSSFGKRSDEASEINTQFRAAVQRLVSAVWCVGCRHCHLSQTADRSSNGDWTNGV